MRVELHSIDWKRTLTALGRPLWNSARDLMPIVCVVAAFQLLVFRQPLPDVAGLIGGLGLVVVGLSLFVVGLEVGLFPLGQQMAQDFARKGSMTWLVAFAFALGFATTFAEPALIAVAGKAGVMASAGAPEAVREAWSRSYAFDLRATVALAVGTALVVGVVRIVIGWPIHYWIMAGYVLVMLLTPLAPGDIVAVAYDSGGVTTSTITVPLTAALGVGLASSIKGRSPLTDGFGLIAFASLTPIVFVLLWGILHR